MSYLSFNEGVFSDIKDKVSANIDAIKNAGSTVAGNTLGMIKNVAVRAKDLTNSAVEGMHKIGNKIGAAGFEDDKDPHALHKTVNSSDNNNNIIKPRLYDNFIDNMQNHNKAINTANAYNNLKTMGLAGSREEINKTRFEKMKQEDEIHKLERRKEKYGY